MTIVYLLLHQEQGRWTRVESSYLFRPWGDSDTPVGQEPDGTG